MWFSVVCSLIDNDTRHHSGHALHENDLHGNQLCVVGAGDSDLKVHALPLCK